MAGVGYANREPGLLHRLDNDTSGLVIAARSDAVFQALRERLKDGEIDKAYLALVDGALPPQVVRLPIAPHPSDPRRVEVTGPDHPSAREAETRVVTAQRVGSATLVEVRAPVAVRHQIRAHLAAIGHPLLGDALYGGPHVTGLDRHFLHASEIVLEHPSRPTVVRAHAPLPPELERVLERLRG
jgi:23S rRNA pseudouridine1911/1915/1917 synthase